MARIAGDFSEVVIVELPSNPQQDLREKPIPWEAGEEVLYVADKSIDNNVFETKVNTVVEFLKNKLKTKKVIATLASVGLALTYTFGIVKPALDKNSQELRTSQLFTQDFIKENQEALSRVDFGTTFIPEIFATPEKAMVMLRKMHEQYNFNDIRIGIRWQNAVDANGNIDFGYYKPFFDYMIANNINIALAYGPDKNPNNPETFQPDEVLESVDVPPDGGVITKDSALAKAGIDYTKKLFSYLKQNYTQEQLNAIKIIQPENEPFQSFGNRGWTIDKEYMKELIYQGMETFPNAKVLVNSAGPLNVDAVLNLFEELINEGVDPKKLIFGWDIYTDIASVNTLVGKADLLNAPVVGQMGPETWDEILSPFGMFAPIGGKFAKVDEFRKKYGIGVEYTELQGKGWKNPNFGIHNFQYGLQQALDTMPSSGKVLIRIWDMDALINGYAKDAKKILEIVEYTNPKTKETIHLVIPRVKFESPNVR